MSQAFGEKVTLSASERAKNQMNELKSSKLFGELRDVWILGAAIGIATGSKLEGDKRETFQNINSLDPEGILAAIMIGLYPDITKDERVKLLVDFAEWGIDLIYNQYKNGLLDLSKLATLDFQEKK